jgi:hypothetical protein
VTKLEMASGALGGLTPAGRCWATAAATCVETLGVGEAVFVDVVHPALITANEIAIAMVHTMLTVLLFIQSTFFNTRLCFHINVLRFPPF